MLEKGLDIDITSGAPVAPGEKKAQRQAREEETLRRAAEFVGVLDSDPGKMVLEKIRNRLQARIERLIKEDPAASELVALLTDLNISEDQANKAVNELFKRTMNRQP